VSRERELSVTLTPIYVGNVTLNFVATALSHAFPSMPEPRIAHCQRPNRALQTRASQNASSPLANTSWMP
jgi:hypothetical protein